MMRQRSELDGDNLKTSKTIESDLDQLSKKAKYLEKQFNEANSQLRDIVSPLPPLILLSFHQLPRTFCLIIVLELELMPCFSSIRNNGQPPRLRCTSEHMVPSWSLGLS